MSQVAATALLAVALAAAVVRPRLGCVLGVAVLLACAPSGAPGLAVVILAALLAFAVATKEPPRVAAIGVAGLVGAAELGVLLEGEPGVPTLLVVATGGFAGAALRERSLLARRLADRVAELEAEREQHAALSVRYERARIAAELHDVVAHAISVMVVQAGAGQRLAAVDPEATEEAFAAIAGAAGQARQDVGRLVALLAEETSDPGPDIALLSQLVDRAVTSGLAVALRVEGDPTRLPPAVRQAGYRVAQEGLTNAMRHAAGASVDVDVAAGADGLLVAVGNGPATRAGPLTGAGTGTGLTGLRERVDALGGRLVAGPTLDGGWMLRARMPAGGAAAADQP